MRMYNMSYVDIIEHFKLNFGYMKTPREFSTYTWYSSGRNFAVSDCHFSDEVVKFNIFCSVTQNMFSHLVTRMNIFLQLGVSN